MLHVLVSCRSGVTAYGSCWIDTAIYYAVDGKFCWTDMYVAAERVVKTYQRRSSDIICDLTIE
jgi:hypothetical protein